MNTPPLGPAGSAFWSPLALTDAGLAGGEHRSRLAWALIPLLLGPPATVPAVVRSPAPLPPVGTP